MNEDGVDEYDHRANYNNHTMQYGNGESNFEANFSRSVKLPFPIFSRKNPIEWLYKAQQFFISHNVRWEHMVRCAIMSFEGKALRWF